MMRFVQEFKAFAVKGNALDMAVAIIVGVAFNKVVNSIVHDIIMPPIGFVIGGVDFRHLKVVLREAGTDSAGAATPEVALRYGQFVNVCLEFLIVALTVFIIVKIAARVIRRREEAEAAEAAAASKK